MASFVAGTPVQTRDGLVPIARLRAGSLVLSKPDVQGERSYKRVVRAVAHADKKVCLLEYVVGDETTARTLVVTANLPVWVKDVGWTAAGELGGGETLELFDGVEAFVFRVRWIFKTAIPDVGWTRDDTLLGPTIDLRDNTVKVSETFKGDSANPAPLDEDDYLTHQVFSIEVEECHTYYVGEAGVWVHDTSAPPPA